MCILVSAEIRGLASSTPMEASRMQFEGALIREQVWRSRSWSSSRPLRPVETERYERQRHRSRRCFPGVPIVLMWQDARGVPQYWAGVCQSRAWRLAR